MPFQNSKFYPKSESHVPLPPDIAWKIAVLSLPAQKHEVLSRKTEILSKPRFLLLHLKALVC